MCYLFCFFLSRSRSPRALHSFPTRRSSDLVQPLVHVALLRVWVVRERMPMVRRDRREAGAKRRVRGALGAAPAALRDARLARDRKSTRLNSSHVEISYAVFCLKKKKK